MPQLMKNNSNKDSQGSDQIALLQSLIDMQKKNISPYQEGVQKALKQSGEQHAMEAIQQGVPVEHIVNEAGFNKNDPNQILAQLVSGQNQTPIQQNTPPAGLGDLRPIVVGGNKPAQNPTAEPMIPQAQPAQQGSIMTPIQQQAGNIVDPSHRTLLGNILNTLGNVTGVNAMNTAVDSVRLSNLSQAQRIRGEEPVQPTEILKQSMDLQKQGRLQPEQLLTKYEQASQPFITQRDAYARIQASISDPSPAGDLSLIFNYLKVLDPGSTVREGEYANVKNAGGIPDQLRNTYNRIMKGEALNPAQRLDFSNRASKLFKSAEMQQRKTTEGFARLGKRNGIDPAVFMRDTGLSQDNNTTKESQKASPGYGDYLKAIGK